MGNVNNNGGARPARVRPHSPQPLSQQQQQERTQERRQRPSTPPPQRVAVDRDVQQRTRTATVGREQQAAQRVGDRHQGVLGALRDSAGLLADAVNPSATIAQRVTALAAVDRGAVQPPRDSRLGAYAATRGYPPGTVGHAVHNAIGTIFSTLGTYGEERIGSVFNSPEARALYSQPVDGPAGRRMAALEHRYWDMVRREDPLSAGGQLGAAFDPAARDFLQREFFSRVGR